MAFEELKHVSVAIIIPDFDYGGEEKRALFFANNYVRHFKAVYFIAPPGAQSDKIDPQVKQVQLKVRGYKNILKVVDFVKKNRIDFVQGHKRTTFPYLFAIEKLTSSRVNFNFDNIYLDKAYLYRFAPKRLYYLSDFMKEHYQGWFKDRENITINMGGEFYAAPAPDEAAQLRTQLSLEDKFVLISLGRLSDQKNQEVTLKALSIIQDDNIVCLMVGEGPKEVLLKNMANELGINHKIKFLGHRSDVNKLLSISHALVQSSIFEGFPNVFIEAVSLGVPIITTKVGSYQTLVNDNGIAVNVNDAGAFANAIVTIKKNHAMYVENAEKLKESTFFQQFHKSKMLENYLGHYVNDVLATP